MKIKWLAIPVVTFAASLLISSPSKIRAATPQLSVQIGGGWDQPPAEFHNDIQRQGFHDGIDAARHDFDHHRSPDVDRHDEYRHPHVDRGARDDYRDGFRRGYEVAMHHLRDHPDEH